MCRIKTKLVLVAMIGIISLGNSMSVLAASENDNVSQKIYNAIEESVVLDKDNYEVKELSVDEIPEDVVPLQFETVEDAIKYLEEYETSMPLEQSGYSCITEGEKNSLARTKRTFDCKYERSLTSCYTLYATVDVDDVTKKISRTYNQKFELSGITVGIGIDNVDIKTNYYDSNKKVRVRAEYQHITYLLVETSMLEIGRSNCYQQMYYTYDKGCHDGEYGTR